MLRSGTTLLQTLLTSHPNLFVARQPFFQFYLDTKERFLHESGLSRPLPLGDGTDDAVGERLLFKSWLDDRQFDNTETDLLVRRATTAKGGGAQNLGEKLKASPGNFHAIRRQLHASLAERHEQLGCQFIGAKEVLCEEYLPALIDHSVRCLLIIRDPRAVIASASHGRYRESVGDRYPLLMLIRLWRKSAAYWMSFRDHEIAQIVRYEDLIEDPDNVLSRIARRLGTESFPDGLLQKPLRDYRGALWPGNSSFGDKSRVDRSSNQAWRQLLPAAEVRFIEACTKPELAALGYSYSHDLCRADISGFDEDQTDVRKQYLSWYRLEGENRELELQRWEQAERGRYHNLAGKTLFLFPDGFAHCAR